VTKYPHWYLHLLEEGLLGLILNKENVKFGLFDLVEGFDDYNVGMQLKKIGVFVMLAMWCWFTQDIAT
jgi:hypothetical protein